MKLKRKDKRGLNTDRQRRRGWWKPMSWHVYWKDSDGFHHHEKLYCHTRNVDKYVQRLANKEQATVEVTQRRKSRKIKGCLCYDFEPCKPNGPAKPKVYDYHQPLYTIHRAKDLVFVKRALTLIEKGWLVKVWKNTNFLFDDGTENNGLMCCAWQDPDNKKAFRLGFSESGYAFRGYMNGCENLLFDRDEYFDKWSRCCEFPKSGDFNELLGKLTLGPAPSIYPEEK